MPDNSGMRKDDFESKQFFRAGDRVFCQNGEWYFQTRENDHGPFPSRPAAERELERYAAEMGDLDQLRKSLKAETSLDDLKMIDLEIVDVPADRDPKLS